MKSKKELPNVKLQKSSVIFMQLGLILAMLIVYIILEQETFYKPHEIADYSSTEDPDNDQTIRAFEIEKPKVKQRKTVKKITKALPQQKPKPSTTFEIVKDEVKKIEDAVLKLTETDEKDIIDEPLTADGISEIDDPEVLEDDIPFSTVEFAPEYPGCKGTKEEKMLCFNKKVKKLIQRKFNSDIAQDIGLSEGVKRINVQFIIDKKGNIVDVNVRAPHKRLEREARRVISLLPKMKPARQGKGNARVKFNLPIRFRVEN